MIDSLFYPDNSLSLSPSPLVFSNSIAIIFFFPQINWNNFFSFHFGNNIATNQLLQFFFLQFSATSLPKLLLNFCHNSYFLSPHPFNFGNLVATICFFFFFPPIFGNLVATILIFSLLTPSILATWLPQLVSLFFFFFFPLLFSATWLSQFLFSLFSLP